MDLKIQKRKLKEGRKERETEKEGKNLQIHRERVREGEKCVSNALKKNKEGLKWRCDPEM